MPITPASGSSTSPVPVSTNDTCASATIIMASSRRRYRSVRQSLASSTPARGGPCLGGCARGGGELPRIFLEFPFEPLEQREGVRRGAGKPSDHVALAQAAHLLGVGLDDRLPDRNLPIAPDHHA